MKCCLCEKHNSWVSEKCHKFCRQVRAFLDVHWSYPNCHCPIAITPPHEQQTTTHPSKLAKFHVTWPGYNCLLLSAGHVLFLKSTRLFFRDKWCDSHHWKREEVVSAASHGVPSDGPTKCENWKKLLENLCLWPVSFLWWTRNLGFMKWGFILIDLMKILYALVKRY